MFVLQTIFYYTINSITMKTDIKYGNLEKSTFRMFYKDGIFDMVFGSMLIINAINIYLDINQIDYNIIMRILIIPVTITLVLVKTFITSKRLGHVKFKRSRNVKRLKAMLIATAALIFTTFMYILSVKGQISADQKSDFIPLLIEFLFLVSVFGLLAYFTDYYNFYIIGLAMGFGSPVSRFLEPFLGTRYYGLGIMLIAGSYLFIIGIIVFVNFLTGHI